jgi:hypothetical protein
MNFREGTISFQKLPFGVDLPLTPKFPVSVSVSKFDNKKVGVSVGVGIR